jgi:hypothetical protein
MDVEAARDARKEKELGIKRKKQLQQSFEIFIGVAVLIVLLAAMGYGVYEIIEYCQGACGN